jgi:hypothetical protein
MVTGIFYIFGEKLHMSRFCGLFPLLSLLILASGVALADSGDPGVAGYPFKKVLIVIFENTDYQRAVSQPFFAKFAKDGALLTNLLAETHPSQPNYLALVSGTTHGVTNNNKVNLNARHVGDLLEAKGKSWKIYLEDYPGNCFTGASSGKYARKHNPFISFLNVQQDAARCNAHLVGSDTFQTDAQSGNLPDFSIYVPNQSNDGHDMGVGYADCWFSSTFGSLLQNPTFMQGLLVIATFDEAKGKGAKPNRIYTALRGDMVKSGAQFPAQASHYSLLKMIEDAFGLGNLGRGDARASEITGIWAGNSSDE